MVDFLGDLKTPKFPSEINWPFLWFFSFSIKFHEFATSFSFLILNFDFTKFSLKPWKLLRFILSFEILDAHFKDQDQCTMGRGGVETKVNKGTCYWVWNLWDKILACMKKDPSCFRKHPEQCFLRPDLKFFFEFQKKFWFAISVNLKMTIQNYFFVKKVCKKKSPIKLAGNFLSRKEHIRAHPNE